MRYCNLIQIGHLSHMLFIRSDIRTATVALENLSLCVLYYALSDYTHLLSYNMFSFNKHSPEHVCDEQVR